MHDGSQKGNPTTNAAEAAEKLPALRPGWRTSEFYLALLVIAIVTAAEFSGKLPAEWATLAQLAAAIALKAARLRAKAIGGDQLVDLLSGIAATAAASSTRSTSSTQSTSSPQAKVLAAPDGSISAEGRGATSEEGK